MRLMRELRCFPEGETGDAASVNTWAGSPGLDTPGPFWVLRAVVRGRVDPLTGYLCNIKEIDSLLREVVIPQLGKRIRRSPAVLAATANALLDAFPLAASRCPAPASLNSLQLCVSPFLRFTVDRGDLTMIQVTESFEFSAAHRLHCPELSDEENQRIFGKCSNPNGHGHNYVVEVTVSGQPDDTTGNVVELHLFRRTVRERVIDRFDHKHLNLDCVEFRSLNPSVENIARVIWDRLHDAFQSCRLAGVRVWETPKTYAEYTGE